MDPTVRHRRWFACLLAGAAFLLPSCTADGQISLFGYTSRPNYDPTIKTVYVPIFKNLTMRRGLEFDLTRAVVREIESKTPFKVVSCAAGASTELNGTIVSLTKNVININPQNEVREAETVLVVNIWWRDLRPGHQGELLSLPKPKGAADGGRPGMAAVVIPGVTPSVPPLPGVSPVPPVPPLPPGVTASGIPPVGPNFTAPGVPPVVMTPAGPVASATAPTEFLGPPVVITSTSDFIPELGGSITTAQQQNFNRLARQIVDMMEIPW